MIANGASLLSLGGSARLEGHVFYFLRSLVLTANQADIGFVLYRVTDYARMGKLWAHTLITRRYCHAELGIPDPVAAQRLWEKHTEKIKTESKLFYSVQK
jgi:hypothetical protein